MFELQLSDLGGEHWCLARRLPGLDDEEPCSEPRAGVPIASRVTMCGRGLSTQPLFAKGADDLADAAENGARDLDRRTGDRAGDL